MPVPATRRQRTALAKAVLSSMAVGLGLLVAMPVKADAAPADGFHKYYTVSATYQGKPENLLEIAGRFLGTTAREQEIFQLNGGRKQPDGGSLADPGKLHAG